MNDDARQVAERVARYSYGKLLSILAARSRDITVAEDALADAFVSAGHAVLFESSLARAAVSRLHHPGERTRRSQV